MHYALALLPATHLPTVSLHTQTRPRHTHTHTHGLVQLAETLGSFFSHKSYMSMNVHTCVRAHTHTHTHTHTHKHTHTHTLTHTDWACTTCSDIGSYFSHCFHKVYLYMPVHTHMTHTYMDIHTHTHTHTQTGLVPLAVILVLISHTVFTKYTCA